MQTAVIVSAARTPIGTFGKAFVDVPAAELGSIAARCAVQRSEIEPEVIDQVVFGCVGQWGPDSYIARAVTLGAGLPTEVPAMTVNRLCGSGLEAINTAERLIATGEADVVLAGGAENMSRYPYVSSGMRWGSRMGDATFNDGLLQILTDPFTCCHMGVTAENVAARWKVDRDAQDEFALESQRRAGAAIQGGRFKDEIVPVNVPTRRGDPVVVSIDEHPRAGTSASDLGRLRPAFKEHGDVTAGNASGINDGAAALVVMSERRASQLNAKPILRVVAHAVAGVPPEIMGIGPIPAVRKVLQKAGLSIRDIDLVELNEAFAAQALACIRDLEMDPVRVNVNGGAIALGHPVGATGAVLTTKLAYEMERRHARYGLVTACIGGGQGIATIFERAN